MITRYNSNGFATIEFDDNEGDTQSNDDKYVFHVWQGQEGVEIPNEFTFTILGNLELDGFLDAMVELARHRGRVRNHNLTIR